MNTSYKFPIILFLVAIATLVMFVRFGLKEIRDILSDEVEIREYPRYEYDIKIDDPDPYIPFEPKQGEGKG